MSTTNIDTCAARAIKPTPHNQRRNKDYELDAIYCSLPPGHEPHNQHKPAKSRKQRGWQCACDPHEPNTSCTTVLESTVKLAPPKKRWRGLTWTTETGEIKRRR